MQGQDLRVLGVQCQGHCIVYRMSVEEGTCMYKLLMICLFRVIPFFTSQGDDDGGIYRPWPKSQDSSLPESQVTDVNEELSDVFHLSGSQLSVNHRE